MNSTVELLAKAQSLYGEARSILLSEKVTAEEIAKAESMRAEAKGLTDRAAALKEIEMAQDTLFEQGELEAVGESKANGSSKGKKAKFADFGEFTAAIATAWLSKGQKVDPRLKNFRDRVEEADEESAGRREGKSLSGATGASGGFLIDLENYGQLMAVAAPLTVVRQRATIIRMKRRQIQVKLLDQTGATLGVPSFFGGIQIFWKEEAALKDISDPKFRLTTLTAHKMIGYTEASDELLEDADPSLADFLGGPLGFPGAIAWMEDYAFLRGSGAGQPQGVVDAPATVAVTRATGGTIKYDDLVNMEAAFMGQNGVWVATQGAKATLMLMNGPSGNPVYLWGNAEKGIPDTLLGRPIQFVDKLPAVGTRGDIMLADFSYYLVGDRQATTFEATNTYKFRTDETAFRSVHRVDGQPWLSAPITLTGISTTTKVSPFVVIAT